MFCQVANHSFFNSIVSLFLACNSFAILLQLFSVLIGNKKHGNSPFSELFLSSLVSAISFTIVGNGPVTKRFSKPNTFERTNIIYTLLTLPNWQMIKQPNFSSTAGLLIYCFMIT